jgi:molybdate transport system substrate-binding protein
MAAFLFPKIGAFSANSSRLMKTVLNMLVIAFVIGSFSQAHLLAADINVSAAASLTNVLQELATPYEKQSGDHIVFNFAASSLLARQIEEGAPADMIFSADEAKLDELAQKGLLIPDSRKSILTNTLAIIVPAENGAAIKSTADLADGGIKHIALGEPATVPAGIYAKEYLQKLGIWDAIKDKVVPVESVRAALAAVESGNADAGIVYKTDAMISKKIKVAYEVPAADGPAISYPLAITKDAKQPEAAGKFATYLESPAAAAVFEKYGFGVKQ